jgi:hypothetical protein
VKILLRNAPALLLLSTAAVLAYLEKSGWGWFLFLGLCCVNDGGPSK